VKICPGSFVTISQRPAPQREGRAMFANTIGIETVGVFYKIHTGIVIMVIHVEALNDSQALVLSSTGVIGWMTLSALEELQ